MAALREEVERAGSTSLDGFSHLYRCGLEDGWLVCPVPRNRVGTYRKSLCALQQAPERSQTRRNHAWSRNCKSYHIYFCYQLTIEYVPCMVGRQLACLLHSYHKLLLVHQADQTLPVTKTVLFPRNEKLFMLYVFCMYVCRHGIVGDRGSLTERNLSRASYFPHCLSSPQPRFAVGL